jgi:hypothetical protein
LKIENRKCEMKIKNRKRK